MEKLTIEQLKALAYDCIANKEIWEARLIELNKLIKERNDQENKQGIPSEKQDREKPIETKSNQETSE